MSSDKFLAGHEANSMCKSIGVCVLMLWAVASATGQHSQVEKLRKDVVELRTQLAAKELELARLGPVKEVGEVKAHFLNVGEAGFFKERWLEVRRVLDDKRMLVGAGIPQAGATLSPPVVILANYPTAGLAEGRLIEMSFVRVVGTEKIENRTLYVIEPYTPPKK